MTYDPSGDEPDYVTKLLIGIRCGQTDAIREVVLVSAAIFGITTIIGLIYWYL